VLAEEQVEVVFAMQEKNRRGGSKIDAGWVVIELIVGIGRATVAEACEMLMLQKGLVSVAVVVESTLWRLVSMMCWRRDWRDRRKHSVVPS